MGVAYVCIISFVPFVPCCFIAIYIHWHFHLILCSHKNQCNSHLICVSYIMHQCICKNFPRGFATIYFTIRDAANVNNPNLTSQQKFPSNTSHQNTCTNYSHLWKQAYFMFLGSWIPSFTLPRKPQQNVGGKLMIQIQLTNKKHKV